MSNFCIFETWLTEVNLRSNLEFKLTLSKLDNVKSNQFEPRFELEIDQSGTLVTRFFKTYDTLSKFLRPSRETPVWTVQNFWMVPYPGSNFSMIQMIIMQL